MRADAVALLTIFDRKLRLEVPLFQRQYVWSQEEQWEPLWDDISRKFSEYLEGRKDAPIHFLGAMVLDQKQTPTTHVEKRHTGSPNLAPPWSRPTSSSTAGGLLEVPGEYVGETVERRYAPLQPELPLLLFVDGKRVREAHPLDRLANNKRRRRALPQPEPAPQRTLKGPLDYITDEYRELVDGYDDDLDDEEDLS